MIKFTTDGNNTCWRDSIACILEINPKKVPDFVKLYHDNFISATRLWLKKKLKKGIVYIAANNFMETCDVRYNDPIGPAGYSIGHMALHHTDEQHAIVCWGGCPIWDNGDDRNYEYDTIKGYFVIYDLGNRKPKTPPNPTKHKRHKKK